MFKHILVPTDGSELSKNTIIKAIAFAKEIDAKVTFFCATLPFPPMYWGYGSIFDSHYVQKFSESENGVANEILDIAAKLAEGAGVKYCKIILSSAEPYLAIIEAADKNGCDLIFMASHGRNGIDALILGSETQKVLTHSKIPVLVYRD